MCLAEDGSTLVVDKPPKQHSMEPDVADYPPFFDGWSENSAISKLPLELISSIAGLSLPGFYSRKNRIKKLYSTRMISRMWRNAIDSTPSLWNAITIDVPLAVNITTIQRSGNCPLDVYICDPLEDGIPKSGFIELFELASREIRRWSTVTLWHLSNDVCSKYLTSPAPLLQSLRVGWEHWDPTTPVTLFEGNAPSLEELEVERLPMDWTSPFIQGLKVFKLSLMIDGQTSAQQVLDILASSPLLEKLSISYSTLDHLRPSQMRPSIIQLPSLNTIDFDELNQEAIRTILSSIRAPNCTSLSIYGTEEDTVAGSNFLDAALGHFRDFQRGALSANNKAAIWFSDGGILWDSQSASSRLQFNLGLQYHAAAVGVVWAGSVIGTAAQELVHDLEMALAHRRLDDEDLAAYHVFSFCQSITKIEMEHDHTFTGTFLDLIGTWNQSEDGAGESPAFPRLKLLVLGSSQGWSLDDLEILVDRRFGTRGEAPDLCIVLPGLDPLSSKWNMAQLQRLRTAKGVESVKLSIGNHTRGMLAVVYDDDTEL